MMDYQTAVRGAFFDIAGVAETPDEVAAQARYLDDGLLFLQEGKIIALLPWQEGEAFLHPLKGYVDLRDKLLLPGFVDAHVHYPQTEMIGAFGEQLLEWLTTYTFPVESQFADAEYAQEIAQFFCKSADKPWHHHRAGVLYPASGIGGGVIQRSAAPQYAPDRRESDDGSPCARLPVRNRRGELRADPGVDPPLASARQAGLCHHPALCPHLNPGVAGGRAAPAGRVSRHLAADASQ